MASTLSLEDYLRYFLLKPSAFECGSDGSEKTIQGALLVATVYKQEKGGESMIYSKRMLGEKNADPVSLFLQDMTGYKGEIIGYWSSLTPTSIALSYVFSRQAEKWKSRENVKHHGLNRRKRGQVTAELHGQLWSLKQHKSIEHSSWTVTGMNTPQRCNFKN